MKEYGITLSATMETSLGENEMKRLETGLLTIKPPGAWISMTPGANYNHPKAKQKQFLSRCLV